MIATKYALKGTQAWSKDYRVISWVDFLQWEEKPKRLHLWANDFKPSLQVEGLELVVHYQKSEQINEEILNGAGLLVHEPPKPEGLQARDLPTNEKARKGNDQFPLSSQGLSELIYQNYPLVLLLDQQLEIQFGNKALFNSLAYQPEEVKGNSVFDLLHPEDHESFKKQALKALEEMEAILECQVRIRHKNDLYFWHQVQLSIHQAEGETAQIFGVFTDIDQQMKAIENLRISNQRFKYSSKATQDVIWDWDIINKRILWGENLSSTFGFVSEELTEEKAFIQQIHPEDRDTFHQSVEEAITNKEEFWQCSYRFESKEGYYRYIIDHGYILRDESGKAYRLIGAMHDNTVQKEYEQRLKSEEHKFRQIFEGSLVGMIMMDLKNLSWSDCNQALLNILGYHKEEFLNTSLRDLVPAEHYQSNLQQLRVLFKDERIEPFQTVLVRKDLSETTVIISAFTNSYKNQQLAWIHVLDLGPIERSSLALAEAENRFKQYIEKSSDVFVTLDEEAKYDYASPNIEQLLGYRPSEIIGRDNLSLMHPEDIEIAASAFQKAFEKIGTNTRSVFRAKHKDGHWIWVESNGRFEIINGKVKAYINVRDIQKEHEIETELRKLSLVANRTSNAVIITNADQEIDWVNDSFCEMSGYTKEEAIGQRLPDLLHGPLSQKIYHKQIAGLLESKKPFKAQNVNYRKSGEHYWIESIVTPVFDDNGKLTNYISIETDISQRKSEEDSIQEYLKVINQQNERLQNLAHIITHNFRSHASNIIQLLRELETENEAGEREMIFDYLQQTAQQLMDSLSETSDLLNRQHEMELPLEECNLYERCLKVQRLMHNEAKSLNATIEISIDPDFEFLCYPPYLDSVIFNLTSNALRYHSPERRPEIYINLEEKEHYYVLHVQDNGLGMDLDKYGDRIFKLKQSFHNHPESSGIGLYMIRAQIESLGGELKVESEVGLGSTFSAYFPK